LAWTLAPGADGPRTVWAFFRDGAVSLAPGAPGGNTSGLVSDTIVLDTRPPSVRVSQSAAAITATATLTLDASTSVDGSGGASDSGIDPTGFSWSFGDGSSGSGPTTTHLYGRVGTFQGSVSVRDRAGNVASAPFTVRVGPTAGERLLRPRTRRLQAGHTTLVTWRADPRASYYNVQLLRRGRKVLSVHPTRPLQRLPARVLRPGRYQLVIWSGLDKERTGRYAPAPWVRETFVVRPSTYARQQGLAAKRPGDAPRADGAGRRPRNG
jgi:hypothetical protein